MSVINFPRSYCIVDKDQKIVQLNDKERFVCRFPPSEHAKAVKMLDALNACQSALGPFTMVTVSL